ncbi:MAG TPA: NAD-dependent epimerase/dehydratase family protein [Duganella sp.]
MDNFKHLILGSGVLGLGIAACLDERGIAPLMLSRSGRQVGKWRTAACDASDAAQLAALIDGPTVLYVCAAPAYWQWQTQFPAMAEGIAAAVAGKQVRIVLADNVYGYGQCESAFQEGSPSEPCSRKGRVRQQVAERLMRLDGQGRVRVAVVRAATFFGPGVEQSSVGKSVFASALSGKPTYIIGDPNTAHAFTYVPDFAAAMVRVGADEEAFGRHWHAPSHSGASLRQFLDQIAVHGGQPVKLRTAGPLMMRMLGVFNPAMRELIEMLYLHNKPWAFSSELTERTLKIAGTPLATAIARTAHSVLPQPSGARQAG